MESGFLSHGGCDAPRQCTRKRRSYANRNREDQTLRNRVPMIPRGGEKGTKGTNAIRENFGHQSSCGCLDESHVDIQEE